MFNDFLVLCNRKLEQVHQTGINALRLKHAKASVEGLERVRDRVHECETMPNVDQSIECIL